MLRIFEPDLNNIDTQWRPLYIADQHGVGFKLDCDHETLVKGLHEALRTERAALKALRRYARVSKGDAMKLASDEALRRDADIVAGHVTGPKTGTPRSRPVRQSVRTDESALVVRMSGRDAGQLVVCKMTKEKSR
jgi:hypothetical protein